MQQRSLNKTAVLSRNQIQEALRLALLCCARWHPGTGPLYRDLQE
jgi:hypothetical protein